MKIIVKKTDEMEHMEKIEICNLFYNVFSIEKSITNFIDQFEKTDLGYSYFCLIYDDGNLVASYAAIPEIYTYYGNQVTFAQSVDTMIKASHRGSPFTLKKMTDKLYKELMKDQISFVYGFPNDNIYQIRERILKWRNIYNLDMYFLPLKVSFINKFLIIFDYLINIIIRFINLFVFNSSNKALSKQRNIVKKNITYQTNKNNLQLATPSGIKFTYSIKHVKNIRIAIIGNIYPLCKENFEKSVKEMSKLDDIDLVAYFGNLDFKPINIFKMHKKLQPTKIRLSGKILLKDEVDERVFNIENWEINPLNFDWSS
jgi:hypothetical protein